MISTPEQETIYSAATTTQDNLMVEALAGTGKTTTLEGIANLFPTTPGLYLAFNKKIATDAEKRLLKTIQVRTFNGFGHRVWSHATGRKLVLNSKKIADLTKEAIQSAPRSETRALWDEYWTIVQGVTHAKTVGYIPRNHSFAKKSLVGWDELEFDEEPTEAAARLIDAVLLRSIKLAYEGSIDFADQIYMPALFGGTYPQFPLVMVDEYQDLNPLNHLMISKLMRTGRLIGVGDPNQNIYGFRGAVQDGMASAENHYKMQPLPLSVSFRCPEKIVQSVWWHVPTFRWHNPGGSVTVRARQNIVDFEDGSAIICRNNAPLFSLAMRLLVAGRSVSVAGSDIGPKVVGQMKRLGQETMSQAELLGKIADWQAAKEANGSKTAADVAGCMKVFASYGTTLGQALAFAQHLFEQEGSITLITGHKAKGLEWPTVYLLDKWLLGDSQQERNLAYVMATRSSDKVFEIDSKRIEG